MSETINKLQKRRVVEVTLGNGETVHIRPLTGKQMKAIAATSSADNLGIALALVNADGSPVLPRGDKSLEDFVPEADEAFDDVDHYVKTEILQAAFAPAPKPKAIAKN